MAQVMQVIMRLSQEKGVVDDADFVNTITRVQRVIEGPTYPSASPIMPEVRILHCLVSPLESAILEIYPPHPTPMPSEGVYTYPYMPSLVISSPPIAQVEVDPRCFSLKPYLGIIRRNEKNNKERELSRLDRNVFSVACINKNGTSFMYPPCASHVAIHISIDEMK